jgi:hypothetical protein
MGGRDVIGVTYSIVTAINIGRRDYDKIIQLKSLPISAAIKCTKIKTPLVSSGA